MKNYLFIFISIRADLTEDQSHLPSTPKIGSSFIVTVYLWLHPPPQVVRYNVNFTFKPAQLPYEQNLKCSKISNSRNIAISEKNQSISHQ